MQFPHLSLAVGYVYASLFPGMRREKIKIGPKSPLYTIDNSSPSRGVGMINIKFVRRIRFIDLSFRSRRLGIISMDFQRKIFQEEGEVV